MMRIVPNPFRKNLAYGFTLKDPASGMFVGLDAEARAKLQGKQADMNEGTVFYMDEAKSYVALLSKIDAVNGTPYYFSLQGQQAVPFVHFSKVCTDCASQDLSLHTNGSVTSPGPGGYLQNVSGSGKYGFEQDLRTTLFHLRASNGESLALDSATGKFMLVKDRSKAQAFEYLNGTIIVHDSYKNTDTNWKNWTVKILKLNPTATAAVLDTVKVQTIGGGPSHAIFENKGVMLCNGGLRKTLRAPTSAGVISLLDLNDEAPALVAFFPPAPINNLVAVRFPRDVRKLQRKNMSSAATVGAAVGGVVLGIVLIWTVLMFFRSVLVDNFLNGTSTASGENALSNFLLL